MTDLTPPTHPPFTHAGATYTTSDVIPPDNGPHPPQQFPPLQRRYVSHHISDLVAREDKDRPRTYQHIPTHARKPHATSGVDPLDLCCEPKTDNHMPTDVDDSQQKATTWSTPPAAVAI